MSEMRWLSSKEAATTVKYLVLIILSAIAILPLAWMFLSAFKTPGEIIQVPPTWFPKKLIFTNFTEAFQMINIPRLYLNSLIVTVACTVAQLFFCSLGGYTFAVYEFPGKNIVFMIILSTLMIPFQVIIIPLFIIMYVFGWINTYQGLILPGMMSAFGIFLMRQFAMSIPRNLFDAAKIDGCSELGIYWRIALPSLKPALSVLGIFTFLRYWEDFLWPLLMIDSSELFTLPLGLGLFSGQYQTQYHLLMAASMMSVIPTLIVFFLLQKRITKGIVLSGLKF